MNLTVRYGNERGVDIEAQFPVSGRKLYVEAKGERLGGHEGAQRRMALGEALLQILSLYDGSSVCVIALPNTRGFRSLAQKVHPPLARLGIHVLFVGGDGQIRHLGPKTPVGLPHRIASLKEALKMAKPDAPRLIEVDFPLREVSEHSVREKNIRHGHISTLHIWWARRPLAASRATALAALLPDDPRRRQEFLGLVKRLAPWEAIQGENRDLEKARTHPRGPWRQAPQGAGPFAGGGAIPLEALRLAARPTPWTTTPWPCSSIRRCWSTRRGSGGRAPSPPSPCRPVGGRRRGDRRSSPLWGRPMFPEGRPRPSWRG